MLKLKDLVYLNDVNISEQQIFEYTEYLLENNSFVELVAPATPGSGIVMPENINKYCEIFNKESPSYKICKFVPASGAATRMFKRLISFCNKPDEENLNEGDFYSLNNTFENIEKFAFYEKLTECGFNKSEIFQIAEKILYSCLNYSNVPKGLIEFHKYGNDSRTSFEEHLHEAISIAPNINEIHFTISEEYTNSFKEKLEEILRKTGIKNITISFSYQDKSTDTPAIYSNGEFIRNKDGNILLRPGGHGALIKNLNSIDADIVFIKNIDNVVHASILDEIVEYKKLLGGILIDIKNKIHFYYHNILYKKSLIQEACDFIENTFKLEINGENFSESELSSRVQDLLNRPLRICGMVKNTGEPGGGPFFVKNKNGSINLQIVEKAQIDLENLQQKEIFENSTHFNPVDIVCYMKNPEGETFDLYKYIDKSTNFVSAKTHEGKEIRVIEHPGLWNGAMADWLTIFVEVPLVTFNPVKELNDLLRDEHLEKTIKK